MKKNHGVQNSKIGMKKLEKNIQNCENPRLHGKGLVENKSGQWRYRIGDYRVICEIQDKEIIVLVLEVGHRREIYS